MRKLAIHFFIYQHDLRYTQCLEQRRDKQRSRRIDGIDNDLKAFLPDGSYIHKRIFDDGIDMLLHPDIAPNVSPQPVYRRKHKIFLLYLLQDSRPFLRTDELPT